MNLSRIVKLKSSKGVNRLRLWGYDEKGNNVSKIVEANDYGYIKKSELTSKHNLLDNGKEYKPYDIDSYGGETLYKVGLPIYMSKDSHKQYYQSDIAIELKYILDNKLEYSRKRHIAYFDIETGFDINHPEYNEPHIAKLPITSISFYSNLQDKYFILAWHPSIKKYTDKTDGNKVYLFFPDEVLMIQTFCDLIKSLNIDIITGWYSHGYDVPYIINRIKVLKLKDTLSPVGNDWIGNKGSYGDLYKLRIAGLDSIDMMEMVMSLNYNLQNNKLETAASEILGEEYGKEKEVSWRDWEDNFEGFLKYAFRDVELLKMIDDKLKIFEYLIQMQMLSGVHYLNDINSVSRLIDSLLIKMFWDEYVFPNFKMGQRKDIGGGYTSDPVPGVHKNVLLCDFASLYPTTMMAYNISPETFLFSLEQLGEEEFEKSLKFLQDNNIGYVDTGYSDELFGKRYVFLSHRSHIGVIPKLCNTMYKLRREYKKLAKTEKTKDLRLVADKKQYAIKIILNSVYGVLPFPFFRLFKPECGDTVTYFGRKAIKFANEKLAMNGDVKYNDTDSLSSCTPMRYRIKKK